MEHLLSPEQIRAQILDAAEKRFRQFGFNKTTMAEIAKDCDMSAANIYRYFDNKMGIGACMAQRCFLEAETTIKKACEMPGLTASEQLEAFFLAALEHAHNQWSKQPRMDEMVQVIINERPDLVEQITQVKTAILLRILQQGHKSGEFEVPDVAVTAQTILYAGVVLTVPIFMHLHTYEEFQTMAKNLARLLIAGLLKR